MQVDFKNHLDQGIAIPKSNHCPNAYTFKLEENAAWALNTALAVKRPLLIFGPPGVGKSQLAVAAHAALNKAEPGKSWQFLLQAINARTEAQDLLYHYDAVARLAQAQVLGPGSDNIDKKLAPHKFLYPGVFWQTLNPVTAAEYPQKTTAPESHKGAVLLVDEIDKADHDMCNSLLDLLDQKRFTCPHLPVGEQEQTADPGHEALIIFTSNNERELPPAFVRRCVVLRMEMGEDIATWLEDRAQCHFPKESYPLLWQAYEYGDEKGVTANAIERAIDIFVEEQEADRHLTAKPNLAEFLDLLNAVVEYAKAGDEAAEKDQQLSRMHESLTEVAKYTIGKAGQMGQ